MSSDSDDIDEDELLQMALKEQSTRNVNYQKPQSTSGARKPVANYVHQPVPKATGSSSQVAGNNRSVARKASLDDDEDSEVEMLSISSGDEDEGKSSRGGGRGKSKGRSKEEDVAWDGEEPDCWKRVDETELSRRVRGMRETRIAPVAQKFERKASVAPGKVALNSLQSFPRGTECVDPLGLGIIDNKALRLITDTSESSPSGRDSLDSSNRDKLMYFSEKFDSKLFISRIHQETSSADLEAGALALKTDLKGRTQQRKQLVKDNFDCFVSCKTTIDDIESKLRRIEEDPEGSGTTHLYSCMEGVSSLAVRAFEPLFERQAQAEKIRSVQGMLQRFRTLFNLPSTIRASITKGEYDLAVREYKKAKSIALPSHLNVLKRVHEEVEKVMLEFKSMLCKSMEEPQMDVTSLENTVRLLLELDPESDPVWHYLNVQNQKIRGLLEKCTSDHEAHLESLHSAIRERALSDAKWKQIQQNLYQSSDVNHFPGDTELPVDLQPMDLNSEEVDALRGRYIRRLTAVLIHHVPDLWKVALSVFSGKFAKVSDSSAIRSEERDGVGKYSTHSLEEVAGMLRSTISLYEVKVLDTFRELEESNTLQPHMSNAIKEISKASQSFEAKESAPPAAVLALRTLHAEVIKIYTLRLCSWMRASTERITRDETWVPVSVLERNKSPYTISHLPLSFRSVLASAMDQISLMIQSLKSEVRKSQDMFGQLQEMQESVRLAFLNSFLDFAAHLEHIGSDLAQNKSNKGNSYMQNGYSNEQEESSDHPGSTLDPHQRLLMVLSNVAYCKDELSHELYKKYKYNWLQSGEKEEDTDIQDLVTSFSGLEETVLEQYTFAKANLIRTAGMNYLLDPGMQWGSAPAVKGVRDAAVELLHTLVSVHAEVFAGAKPLLDKTLGILVEGLIDTFISLFHENQTKEFKSLDANGFCQLMLEIEYFETILNPYLTADAKESLKSFEGALLEKATESISDASEFPGHQRRPTRGSEESDERQHGMAVSPDDLIALAQQCSSEWLQAELERTRLNTSCFAEDIPLDSTVPEPAKAAYASYRGSMDSPSRNHRGTPAVSVPSPNFSRHRHR